MTEETKQDTAQENQSDMVENKSESPSSDGLLPEIMAKKEKIKTLEAELAKRDANDEKRRTKKLEEEGKFNEVITELRASNEKLLSENQIANEIVSQHKVDLINSITSDESKREELSKHDIETLRFIKNEIGSTNVVHNPQESLGSVRTNNVVKDKDWTTMDERERRKMWPDIVASMKK